MIMKTILLLNLRVLDIPIFIENKYLASQQKEMEQKNLELLNYEGNPKDTSDEYTDTDFMRKILKCVANS